jgi:signal transduction histidine kinase
MTTTEPRPAASARTVRSSWGRVRRAVGGIRVRVLVGSLLLAVVALGANLLVIRQVLLNRLDDQIEEDLVQEAEELRNLAATGVNRDTGEPFADDVEAIFDAFLETNVPVAGEAFYTLVAGQPHRYSADAPAQLLDDPDLVARWRELETAERTTVESTAGEARTLAVPLRTSTGVPGVFVVAAFPREARADLEASLRSVTVTSALVLVLAGAAAWGLAGRIVRPVGELTEAAHATSESDLTARIPVEGNDELADLGRTFNDMLDRLERAMRDQRQFLDAVAHELRTPLTIARGHLELASGDPAEQEATIAVVTEELDRMTRYVEDLLVLAKAEQPDFLRPAPFDVGELVEDLAERAGSLGDRRWVLDDHPRPGMAAAVADAGRLEQALLSLLTNAVQHTAPGDEIGVGATVGGDTVAFRVRDTGPGVDPAIRDQIFQRGQRGPTSATARPEGTGIGLAIVATIAARHDGHVRVEDTPGGGATFVLTVPLDPDPDPEEPRP